MDDNERPICLMLAPFNESSQLVRRAVEEALAPRGVRVVWPAAESDGGVANIVRFIDEANIIIADVTDANPNVMYEMGFAYARRKPVLPVIRRGYASIPSDIVGRVFLVYDPADTRELITVIRLWSESYLPVADLLTADG